MINIDLPILNYRLFRLLDQIQKQWNCFDFVYLRLNLKIKGIEDRNSSDLEFIVKRKPYLVVYSMYDLKNR